MYSSKVHEGIPDLITENPPHKGLQLPVGTCVLGICILLLLGFLIQAWWTVSVAFSAAILPSLKFGQQCAYPQGKDPCFPNDSSRGGHSQWDTRANLPGCSQARASYQRKALWSSSHLPSCIDTITWECDAWNCSSQHVTNVNKMADESQCAEGRGAAERKLSYGGELTICLSQVPQGKGTRNQWCPQVRSTLWSLHIIRQKSEQRNSKLPSVITLKENKQQHMGLCPGIMSWELTTLILVSLLQAPWGSHVILSLSMPEGTICRRVSLLLPGNIDTCKNFPQPKECGVALSVIILLCYIYVFKTIYILIMYYNCLLSHLRVACLISCYFITLNFHIYFLRTKIFSYVSIAQLSNSGNFTSI